MNHNYAAQLENTRIRPLQKKDIESLRSWRNDETVSRYLSPISFISKRTQEKWFAAYQENSDEIMFAVEETEDLKKLVGSLSLYHFAENQVEIGKIIIGDPEAHGRGIGRRAFLMAMAITFYKLGVDKIVCSVHQDNAAAYRIYDKIGFLKTGSHSFPKGGREDELEIDRLQFYRRNEEIQKIKIMNEDLPDGLD